MKCESCDIEISEAEVFRKAARNLCEDCFVEEKSVPRTCDPMAVRSAKLTRESQGQVGADGLMPLQKEIYEYIKEKEKVSPEELMEHFNLSQQDFQKSFAVLRHCELCRMTKEGGAVYATLF